MNKKIITVSVLLLALVVLFVACKKGDEYKVDYEVTLSNGTTVQVFEDENGENFVTNVDGDQIPVTSDVDGFYDDIEDLITETTTKKSDKTDENDKNTSTSKPDDDKNEPSSDNEKEEPSSNNDKEEPSSDKEQSSGNDNEEPSSESTGVEIGSDTNKGGSISWSEIVGKP